MLLGGDFRDVVPRAIQSVVRHSGRQVGREA